MANVFYNELIANLTDIQSIEHNISEKAQEICARREKYAEYLEGQLVELKRYQTSMNSTLGNLHSSSSSMVGIDKEAITSKCNAIKKDLADHIERVEKLCIRFKNKRIRIVSFGPKTQGKSVFTQLYTRLDDSIVAVKPDGNGIDKTGAINVIKHDGTLTSPRIIVHFKTQQEVVDKINSYISLLPQGVQISTFRSFQDVLIAKNNNSIITKLSAYHGTQPIAASCKAGLESFFASNRNISEAGAGEKEITVDQMPIYNDMQYNGQEGQRYAIVDYIEILTNLGNDFYKYFEIGDTKGSSIDAGGNVADIEIFEAIDNSDAAFSISRVGSGQNNGEYITTNLFTHYQEDIGNLHDKLFIILNMEKGSLDKGLQLINSVVGNIEVQHMAEQIYTGCLCKRPIGIEYDERDVEQLPENAFIDPEKFVRAMLLDMLNKIVTNTKRNDDGLIDKASRSTETINFKINELKSLVNGCDVPCEESEDGLIIEVIKELRDKTYNQINLHCNSENNHSNNHNHISSHVGTRRRGFNFGQEQHQSENVVEPTNQEEISYTIEQPGIIDYEEQYKKLRSEKMSIFKLLTGENRTTRGKENQSVKDEIEESVRYIYTQHGHPRPCVVDEITDKVISRPSGNTSDSGRFIECVSMMYSSRIKENFNKKLTPQNEIQFKDEADELFRMLWKGLKLDSFTGWGEYSHDKFSEKSILNEQLGELLELYKDAYEATTDPISLFTPYDTLLEYFNRYISKERKSVKHKETDIVIDDEILVKTLVDLIRIHNIPKMIVEKATDKKRRVDNLRTQIAQEIAPQTSFVQRILPLYRLPEASPVFNEELRQRRDFNEKIRSFNEAKSSINALSAFPSLSIPL